MALDALFSISKTYSPADVVLLIGGVPIFGFDGDGIINFEPSNEDTTMSQGCDGEVTINRLAPSPMTATIMLKETSASNDVLAGFRAAQRATGGYTVPFVMLDPSTGESITCAETVFAGRPSISKGKESGSREWPILLPNPVYIPVA